MRPHATSCCVKLFATSWNTCCYSSEAESSGFKASDPQVNRHDAGVLDSNLIVRLNIHQDLSPSRNQFLPASMYRRGMNSNKPRLDGMSERIRQAGWKSPLASGIFECDICRGLPSPHGFVVEINKVALLAVKSPFPVRWQKMFRKMVNTSTMLLR